MSFIRQILVTLKCRFVYNVSVVYVQVLNLIK